MAHKLQIQYEDMEAIAKNFETYASDTEDMINRLTSAVGALQDGGWKGLGASNMYNEWENEVLPQLKIVQMGLETAGQKTREMIQMFQDAEQTILSFFASL